MLVLLPPTTNVLISRLNAGTTVYPKNAIYLFKVQTQNCRRTCKLQTLKQLGPYNASYAVHIRIVLCLKVFRQLAYYCGVLKFPVQL